MAYELTQSGYSSSEPTVPSHESTASSQESTATTSSTSPRIGAKEMWDHEDARRFKLLFAVALSLMVLGVLTVAGLFVTYGAFYYRGGSTEDVPVPTIASGPSLDDWDILPPIIRSRTRTTRATHQTEGTSETISMTGSATTSEKTPDSEEPSTNGSTTLTTNSDDVHNITDNGVSSKYLLCTYGAKLNSTMVFPPDGLCDFVFFDSLYKNDTNKLDGPFSPNFDYFLTQAKANHATTYGAGLDYGNMDDVHEFLDSNNTEHTIEGLLADGIRHYGILNTPATLLRLEDVKIALEVLKEIDHILADKSGPRYTVFAASLYSDALKKSFASMLENEYVPDLLIMYGHFFVEDQAWPDCQIVPPTFVTSPDSGAYMYSLSTAHDSVMYLQFKNIKATSAVSVAMFGRWYMPRYLDDGGASDHANYSLFSPCQGTADEQLGSVTQVCKHPMWRTKVYSTEHQAEYCFDKTMERTFAFDSTKSLISKLCSEKRRMPSTKYAVAAFNLEYADSMNECGEGNFGQLRVLRQLVDYMHEKFSDASAYDGCLSIYEPSGPTTVPGNHSSTVQQFWALRY